jgi:tyrosine-specific transport protein
MFIAIPVIVTSFTSHLIVPTLTDYLKKDAKDIFKVLIIGSVIPLIIYLIWLASILGTLPLDGPISFMSNVFKDKASSSANIGEVLSALSLKIKTTGISFFIDAFADISVMTSYLSVSLALFHFNKDSYGLKTLTSRKQNIISMILTFAFPLMIVQYNPNLFISALSYTGVCIAILLVIMPAIIIIKMLHSGHEFQYKISKMKPLLYLSIILGLCIILIKLTPI